VTGAAGNLGRLLVERLLENDGIEQIVAIDKAPVTARDPRVVAVAADVREPAIAEHLRGCDAVAHLAFIVERGSRDPELVQSVNVGGSQNVIGAAARQGAAQVVYASSIVSYGFHPENRRGPLDESAPIRGNDAFYYARTKAEVERWLDELEAAHPALRLARLRPSVFLGPRGGREIDVFRGGVFPYIAGLDAPMHLTHEDDVVEAFALALETGARGAFNLASDQPLAMSGWPHQLGRPGLKLPRLLVSAADLAYRAKLTDVDPVWFRMGASEPIVVTSERARRELGWRPDYPTTGAVLRALADRATAAATRAVRQALDAWQPLAVEGEAGEDGIANLYLTGDRPGEWHLTVRAARLSVAPGVARRARDSLTIDSGVFERWLAGQRPGGPVVSVRGDARWRDRLDRIVRAAPAARGTGLGARLGGGR
jgi:nucleoside-diphosphate-sugar epimerase